VASARRVFLTTSKKPGVAAKKVSAVMIEFMVAFYFAPWVIAALRNRRNATGIFLLNLFLGWTFVGWVAALIWSASD
jgi:hypothetical protein